MHDCLFCKIARGNVPSEILYQDDEIIAIKDIAPKAPFHALIIPRAHVESAAQLTPDEGAVLGGIFALAARLVREAGYSDGYRVVTNVGAHGGQSVAHLHFHVLAGRQLAWPPG